MKIKIVFIGTADIGAPLLQTLSLDKRFEVKLVVTQIDKPAGRKMELKASPIKLKAEELGLTVFQPENINFEDSIKQIKKAGADMIVLMAYGQILKSGILDMPEYGCINVHASLLPKHRGASPVQQSLLHQDSETGISIMRMVKKMDTGPVYAESKMPISNDDNAISLLDKLSKLTAEKTPDILFEIVEDGLEAHHQDHQHATYCKKIHKTDGAIDWNESADSISAKVRGLAGWPGTHTFWEGKRIKILSAQSYSYDGTEKPGTIIQQGNAILVKCKKDALLLEEMQMEGKKPVSASEFVKGYKEFIGSVVG